MSERMDAPETVGVVRGWRTYQDGSTSPIERWVKHADGDWVSLDSSRRTSGDIHMDFDAGVNAPDVPTALPGSGAEGSGGAPAPASTCDSCGCERARHNGWGCGDCPCENVPRQWEAELKPTRSACGFGSVDSESHRAGCIVCAAAWRRQRFWTFTMRQMRTLRAPDEANVKAQRRQMEAQLEAEEQLPNPTAPETADDPPSKAVE